MLTPFLNLLSNIIGLYVFILFLYIVLSWLSFFNVLNPRNRAVFAINDVLYKMTEPVLRPIRRFQRRILPTWQVDLSPIILVLGLYFIQDVLHQLKRF